MNFENICRFGSVYNEQVSVNCPNNQLQNTLYNPTINCNELERLLASHPGLVNQPLPNGELPLHLAVREICQNRESQFAKVEILIQHGADVEQKDSQGLTAFDHAAFLKDSEMLIKMLSVKLGKIQDHTEMIGDAENLEDILTENQTLVTCNPSEMDPIHRAAYEGNLASYSLKKMIDFPPNQRGERPLHFAIKGRQTELVRQILEKQPNIDDLTITRNSYLHYAVAANSPEIVKMFIPRIPLDQRNTRGETALHYAAAAGRFNLMQDLVKGGANPKIVDSGGRSPLALFLLASQAKDPLAVNETQLVLAGLTALYWLAQAAKQSGWEIPYLSIILPSIFLATTAFELKYLVDNLTSSGKKFAALCAYFTLGYLPPINLGYHLWRTSYLVQEAFSALGAAWKNLRYRKWDAVCKLSVTGTNTASAVHSVYKSFETNKYFYKLYQSEYFSDLLEQLNVIGIKMYYADPSFMVDIDSLIEQVFGYKFFNGKQYGSSSTNSQTCQHLKARDYRHLDIYTRISDQKLIPACPEHAAILLSPEFDKQAFCEEVRHNMGEGNPQRLHLLKKIYRQVTLQVHPDKLDEEKTLICGQDCFKRATEAKETLEAELKRPVYCRA